MVLLRQLLIPVRCAGTAAAGPFAAAAACKNAQCMYTATRASSTHSSSNCSSSSSSSSRKSSSIDKVKLIEDKVVYEGWRTVKRRLVAFPDGSLHAFDVTDAPPAILALPWNSKTKTFTLLREYCPGPHRGMFCVVAGLLEAKHQSVEHCVLCETEEEAGIRGGSLVPIMNNSSMRLPGAKYTAQPFLPFLVIDGEKVLEGRRAADADELLETHEAGVSEALDLAFKGEMTSTGTMMLLLSVEKLRKMGHISN